MKQPSENQRRMLAFIKEFARENGYPPTVRDIQAAIGMRSTSVVDYNLRALEAHRLIRRNRHVSRGIEVLDEPLWRSETSPVPLLGQIAAGQPIPVPDDPVSVAAAETVEVPLDLLRGRPDGVYALLVKGYSMVDALIADGDVVLMRHADTAENGQTVAVWLRAEKETTLKRFYHEGERVRLQPANVTMEPIYTDSSNVEIQGRLVGVLRRLA